MKIKNTRIKNFANDILTVLPSGLLLSFTFFVFGPLQMYLTNAGEFWFKLKHILPTVIISFFACLIIVIALYIIVNKKIKGIYAALIFGIGIALYLQGNFLSLDYGVMDGSKIDWGSYGIQGVINTAIWVICIAAPVVLAIKWPSKLKSVITAVSLFIVAIQVITTGVLFASSKEVLGSNNTSSKQITVTRNGIFSLSSKKNEVIFVLDTFDASYMNGILEDYPEYKELFKDFIYFNNVLGAYPTTKAALPHILTGVKYDNSVPYSEYIDNAFDKTVLYDDLISNGYDIGLYTGKYMSPKHAFKFINIAGGEEVPESNFKLGLMMYKTTAFSYFPHILKENFWYYSGDFNKYKGSMGKGTSSVPYLSGNVEFYDSLITERLSFQNKSYAFRLYHLNGAHPPYKMTEDITYDENGTSVTQVCLGSLNIILEYIDQLKEAGVYDNTSIIIMADHGKINMSQNPVLMVKPTNAKEDFSIVSAPVSYDDLLNTMLYLATGDSSYQPNIFTWQNDDNRTRQYLYYCWDDSWDNDYLPDMYEYVTNSAAADDNYQLHKTGRVYTSKGIIENDSVKISLGETLIFGNGGKIQGAFDYGFSGDEGTHIWSVGEKSKLTVSLADNEIIEEYLAVSFIFNNIAGSSQRLSFYVNGTFIEEKVVTSIAKPVTYIFPSNLISDTKLLQMEFLYPDATTVGNDKRILAFSFAQMKIDYVKNLLTDIAVIDGKKVFDFSKEGNSNILTNEGWYGQEDSHRWTSDSADIIFYTGVRQDYIISVEYHTYQYSGDTRVLLNGKEIAVWESNTSIHTDSIVLPKELLNDNGIQKVTFVTDESKSPLESGIGDSRILGIDVNQITIMPRSEEPLDELS